MSSNHPYIGGSNLGISRSNLELRISWQAQYLVSLKGDFTCSTHCKWLFICVADQWWDLFCVAGAVIRWSLRADLLFWRRINHEIQGSIWWSWSMLECDFSWQVQHVVQFWEIAGAWNVVFFIQNASPRWDELGLRSGGCEITILSSDYPRNVVESSLYWRKQSRDFSLKSGTRNFLAVKFEDDSCCSAYWKWPVICDADQSWHSFCMAGAVFGEVGGWHLLLRAL